MSKTNINNIECYAKLSDEDLIIIEKNISEELEKRGYKKEEWVKNESSIKNENPQDVFNNEQNNGKIVCKNQTGVKIWIDCCEQLIKKFGKDEFIKKVTVPNEYLTYKNKSIFVWDKKDFPMNINSHQLSIGLWCYTNYSLKDLLKKCKILTKLFNCEFVLED